MRAGLDWATECLWPDRLVWSCSLAEDLKWELTILEVVHGFDLALLQETLKDQVMVPAAVDGQTLRAPGADLRKSVQQIRRWLKLLDLGVSTAMVREALTANPDQDLAEALLKYFAGKRSEADNDRDKTDFIATFLYKNPRVPGQWDLRGYSLDGTAPVPPFEIALLEILGDTDLPDLSREHDRLLLEFEHIREDVDNLRHFDELVDSNVILRVREMKQALGMGFYHPRALAIVADYNLFFSKRFGELFGAATRQIKSYALKTQEQGGSVGLRVHGDVTVGQLADVQDERILRTEYGRAQDQFRHVSRLKKAVDAKLQPKPASTSSGSGQNIQMKAAGSGVQPAMMNASAPKANPFAVKPSASGGKGVSLEDSMMGPAGGGSARGAYAAEQTKLKSVEESIRAFVRAANPKFRQIVPMKFGNLGLTPAEADAYCADHLSEKSFRADNARSLVRIVAIIARIGTEIEELKQKSNSTHLWKQHADAIVALMDWARETTLETNRVMVVAQQRGLVEKVAALNASLQKLQEKSAEATIYIRDLTARAQEPE